MGTTTTAIWSFNRRITHRLAGWSAVSVVGGLAAIVTQRPFWRSFGIQCATWGAIDAAIALGGHQAAERKQATATSETEVAHARQLRRLLWVNAGLDMLYIAGGVTLLRSRPANKVRQGHGAGIVLQGAFLLLFDVLHALRVPHIEAPGKAK